MLSLRQYLDPATIAPGFGKLVLSAKIHSKDVRPRKGATIHGLGFIRKTLIAVHGAQETLCLCGLI